MKVLGMRWSAVFLSCAVILVAGLGARAQASPPPFGRMPNHDHHPLLGVRAMNVKGQLAQYFQVPGGRGILVVKVMAGSAADKAGVKAGDVIYQVEGQAVHNVEQLEKALRDNCYDNGVSLGAVRKGMTLAFRVAIHCQKPASSSGASI